MRLVTYNIQFGRGKDDRFDLARIAKAVEGADVIAMQEVERFWNRSGMVDQVAELTRLLPGYHWVYGPGLDLDGGVGPDAPHRRKQFGNLVLARTRILSARNHLLPKIGLLEQLSMQRAALEGVIECAGGPVRFYSVHLAHVSSLERRRQVARLREILGGAAGEGGVWSGAGDPRDWAGEGPPPPMPGEAIVLGDFNMEPDSPEYEMMAGPLTERYGRVTPIDGFADAWLAAGNDPGGGLTWPRADGHLRVDYVFVGAALATRVRGVHVDSEAQGSDHQPLWVDIDL